MKKNIAMRIAAFLFILTMISTCAFATTFAKYVTSGDATDSARVAKWGVTVDVAGDAFAKNYKDLAVESGDDSLTVSGSEKVVAPGTKGTLLTLSISGTPEVDTKVTIEFSIALTNWVVESDEYCPLVFKVNDTEIAMTTTVAAFETALEEAINAVYTCEANADLAKSITVTWEWAFSTGDANDKLDTELGNWELNAPEIEFSIECVVVQLD